MALKCYNESCDACDIENKCCVLKESLARLCTINVSEPTAELDIVAEARTELTANEKIALKLTEIWASNPLGADVVIASYRTMLKELNKEEE